MAIYKLKDLYSKKPQYGASLAAQQEGKYKYVRQADIDTKVFNTFVDSGPFLYEGDILISRAGAYAGKTYMHDSRENCVFAGFLVRYKFKQEFMLNEYFYFWTKTSDYVKQMMQLRTGAAQPNFNPGSVGELVINIPPIKIQQEIIDIIEQNEELFFTFTKCVRIDNPENTKKDMNLLIDIIEPIEKQILNISSIINNTKSAIIKKYELSDNELIKVSDMCKLANNKRDNQMKYYATNAVNELRIDSNKVQILTESKIPSRANVSPEKNSFIVSKLDGENKVYFFSKKPDEVFSTGFFNIETEFVDHFLGFILSESFKKQKSIHSTGTTMQGINNKTLNFIKIKECNKKDSTLAEYIYTLSKIKNKLLINKNAMIKLLIK